MSTSADEDPERLFRSLYEETYADLVRFVQRRTGPEQVDDVVAEAFVVVWRRLGDLPEGRDDRRAWLFGITRNVLLNERRSTTRRVALGIRLAETPGAVEGDASDLALARVDLGRAWARLTETHQEALGLSVFDAMNATQAAAVLGISPVAFRLRLTRARRALRLHLDHAPSASTSGSGTARPEPSSSSTSSPRSLR